MIPVLVLLLSFFSTTSDPDTVLVRDEGVTTARGEREVLGWRKVPAEQAPTQAQVVPNVHLDLLDADPTGEPLFGDQWALPVLGAERAWQESLGNPDVVIAVIDSGLQLDHPELAPRLAVNEGEIPHNGLDDDGNGLVDDVIGWDVIEDDNDPTDPSEGHGTEVAGVLAASLNGEGIIGLAPATSILPIRACTNSCEIFSVAWAITYAVDRGANIINLSLGGIAEEAGPLGEAVDYAEERGVLVVAAAGNTSTDIDQEAFVPASLPNPNVVAVAATDRDDTLWSESNFGRSTVELAAPGVEIATSTLPELGTYRTVTGTSFAAPHVAGSAALMLSIDPAVEPSELIRILGEQGRALASLSDKTAHGTRVRTDTALIRVRLADIGGLFESDIVWLAVEEITRGCNPPENDRYCPHDPVTRAEMAAFLARALDLPSGPDAFTDDDHTIFANDIDALAHAGITQGCNPPQNDRYCPHDPVTRAEMAALLARALDLPSGPDAFTDDDHIIFANDIDALAHAGITQGCNPPQNDRYCPHDPVTRAEMAAFFHRAFR